MSLYRDMALPPSLGEVSPYRVQFNHAMGVLNDQERRIKALADALPREVVAELLAEIEWAREEILDGFFA